MLDDIGKRGCMGNNFRKDDGYNSMDRIMSWINNGDTKVSFGFAIIAIITGSAFATDVLGDFAQNCIDVLCRMTLKDWEVLFSLLGLALIIAFAYFLLRGMHYFIKALIAKVDADVFKENGLEIDSKLFWGSISNKTFAEYSSEIENLTEEELISDINSQSYIMSKICNAKFANYNKGIKALYWAILIYVVLLFVMNIGWV